LSLIVVKLFKYVLTVQVHQILGRLLAVKVVHRVAFRVLVRGRLAALSTVDLLTRVTAHVLCLGNAASSLRSHFLLVDRGGAIVNYVNLIADNDRRVLVGVVDCTRRNRHARVGVQSVRRRIRVPVVGAPRLLVIRRAGCCDRLLGQYLVFGGLCENCGRLFVFDRVMACLVDPAFVEHVGLVAAIVDKATKFLMRNALAIVVASADLLRQQLLLLFQQLFGMELLLLLLL